MNILQTLLAAKSGYESGQTLLLVLIVVAAAISVADILLGVSLRRKKKKEEEPAESVEEPAEEAAAAAEISEEAKEESDEAASAEGTEKEDEAEQNAPVIVLAAGADETGSEEKEDVSENDSAAFMPGMIAAADVGGEGASSFQGKFLVTYDKSFQARLIQADAETQEMYGEIKNYLLSYKGMKTRLSWFAESFRIVRKLYAKLRIVGKAVQVYLALNPDEYAGTKYEGEDAGDRAKYREVPFQFDVTGSRKVKYAKYLISRMMEGAEQGEIPTEDYREEYQTTEALFARGLIRYKNISSGNTDGREVKVARISDVMKYGRIAELIRDEIGVTEADSALSDELAEKFVEEREESIDAETRKITRKEGSGKKEIVNIDALSQNFEAGETVTLAKLRRKKLAPNKTGYIKVLARGRIDKPLTVEANDFSAQAIKMIILTGGTVIRLKPQTKK